MGWYGDLRAECWRSVLCSLMHKLHRNFSRLIPRSSLPILCV